MILKNADDRKRDIDALRALESHPDATAAIKENIKIQIKKINIGADGEADAAHYLRVQFSETPNWLVVNDLRLKVGDNIAQIDHILINRLLDVWLCESKAFTNGLKINEFGEFLTFFNRRPIGVSSPVEQNARHARIMERLFASGAIDLPKRLGFTIKPTIRTLVLVAKGAIQRPKTTIKGMETIIKADQVVSTIDRIGDSGNPLDLAKIVSAETLAGLGEQIVALHNPSDFDWPARFGLTPVAKGCCDACSGKVSDAERKFCEERQARFNQQILCMRCQRANRKAPQTKE